MNYLTYFNEINMTMPTGTWMSIGDLDVNFGILTDSLSMVVIVPVGIVTLLVLFYAIDYMKDDPNRNRFLMILSVFAMFMTILVMSENYLMMFIGWEFVGIISYLLMSFWSTRIAANKNALSAVLLNRMGDTFFVICLGTMITVFHALDFDTMSLMTPHMDTYMLNMLALLTLLASTAKSAQLGLHAWLLGAMEGPTPVSSLLHAATMVCSGVFVLVRSSFILEYTPSMLLTMLWLGGVTTLMSGLMAITSNDMKRVMALSTMSQLAMMMLAMGSSAYDLAIYHLYCHAFFKALLFMSAGSIMHSYISESQDMRKYGGLLTYTPYSYTTMLMASLSLMAMPGLSGYYSKDIIIETLYGSYNISGYMMFYMATASASLTAIYSLRVSYLTFNNMPNGSRYTYSQVHESLWMAMPMFMLSIYSMYLGFGRDSVVFDLNMSLPHTNAWMETEYTLPAIVKLLPLMLGLSLSISLVIVYEYYYKMFTNSTYNYLNSRIYYDQLLNNLIIRPTLKLGGLLNTNVDNGLLKVTGNTGASRLLNSMNMLMIINIIYMFIVNTYYFMR
ncbi:NADH-ubiquinone oxidoreductase chain 5 (mitochondrion) [[Candida] railenensis]|uniref:NADH-ubiquinone oxidoreductase chain 5 n=1 Tax=[Candida] railenensis TaxID=45579 RepID=UPI0020281527|nr:NADH-ubiquinone oxidoreductase chain 5 [[Candida] railenensis]CAH2356109.1 NADH-ubiquinone oxidoreductase chain 5 [[Candida] railenensis]